MDNVKVTVLMTPSDFDRFSSYCEQQGFKKSTLITRLIREHLDAAGFVQQKALFAESATNR